LKVIISDDGSALLTIERRSRTVRYWGSCRPAHRNTLYPWGHLPNEDTFFLSPRCTPKYGEIGEPQTTGNCR